MIRISLSFFYGLGAALRPVAALTAGQTVTEVWSQVYAAETDLRNLLSTDWFAPAVRAASAPGFTLLQRLKEFTDRTDFTAELTISETYALTKAVSDFEMVLRSELYVADAYFVSSKAGYDTSKLIGNAEQNFPGELGIKVPKAIGDIREAGKCLAFELSTASGFHVLRATETVVRNYWTAVTGGLAHPRPNTLGKYVHKLEELNKGNKKTVAVLKQITALHRNPLMHPEESLSLEDAVGLFGICISAITAMLKEIPSPKS